MDSWIIEFGGLAVLYGAVASVLVLTGLYMCGRRQDLQIWPLLFATLTFVFLTQHPFPSPGSLNCPVESAQPQLFPFRFLRSFSRLYAQDAALWTYLTNQVIAASAMNLLLCVGIGMTLARHTLSMGFAVFYGACLTLSVELTQLTGTWGIYPCAYRQFNVDDLILNASGVVCGAALIAIWRNGRQFSS